MIRCKYCGQSFESRDLAAHIHAEHEAQIEFYGDTPFPITNIHVYNKIYVLEQWLRRIVFTALIASSHKEWKGYIPPNILKKLKSRLNGSRNLIYLDCENPGNIIWLTTLEELHEIMGVGVVQSKVEELTGYTYRVLSREMEKLIEIRNLVAHNRTTTEVTFEQLKHVVEFLGGPIATLKETINKIGDIANEYTDDNVMSLFVLKAKHIPLNQMQCYISASRDFYQLTRLPMEEDYYVIASKVLDLFSAYDDFILAILVNKHADELTISWVKDADLDSHIGLIDTFLDKINSCFGTKPYSEQSPKYVCHPKIWFYEGDASANHDTEDEFPW